MDTELYQVSIVELERESTLLTTYDTDNLAAIRPASQLLERVLEVCVCIDSLKLQCHHH